MKKIIIFFCFLITAICNANAASVIGDTEIENVIYELIEPLARAANIPDNRLGIHIINSNDFNAFVSNGEDVYIYTGLITAIENPNALQAVVSHEMGHMLGGHMAHMSSQMRAEMSRSLVMQALGVALMVANPMLGMGVMAGAGGMGQQSLNAFSRDEERIADNMGIDLLVRANLSTDGFITVMKQMNEMSSTLESRVNPNNLNHPLTSERLTNITTRIAELKVDGKLKNTKPVSKSLTERYGFARAKLIGYLQSESYVTTTFPNSDKSSPAIYARSIRAMRSGNLEMAKTGTLTLISRAPKNPYFYELLGDIEYQYGHYDDSINAYEKSLTLVTVPAPQIQTALALVLSTRKKPGDIERSVEMVKRANLTTPTPLAYWVLASAEQARGNDGISDWAFAEYYTMMRNKKQAQKYAKSARKKLDKDTPEYIKSGDILR